jgi:hypothetical protein
VTCFFLLASPRLVTELKHMARITTLDIEHARSQYSTPSDGGESGCVTSGAVQEVSNLDAGRGADDHEDGEDDDDDDDDEFDSSRRSASRCIDLLVEAMGVPAVEVILGQSQVEAFAAAPEASALDWKSVEMEILVLGASCQQNVATALVGRAQDLAAAVMTLARGIPDQVPARVPSSCMPYLPRSRLHPITLFWPPPTPVSAGSGASDCCVHTISTVSCRHRGGLLC